MKKVMLSIFTLIFAGVFIVSLIKIVDYATDSVKSKNKFNELSSMIAVDEGSEAEKFERISASEKYGKLHKQNKDFIGWIKIEGTDVDYPVMYAPDEKEKYLRHDFNMEYNDRGVPYIQEDCVPGISDNLIIYGHNMDDGSMFEDLTKLEDYDFYKKHKYIEFDTLEDYGRYEIVAVFKTSAYADVGFPYYQFVDADNVDDYNDYINTCKELALYDTGVTPEFGDKLISLSTCEYSQEDGRLVVVASYVDNGETKKDK